MLCLENRPSTWCAAVPAGNVDASALLKDLTAAAARSIGKDEEVK